MSKAPLFVDAAFAKSKRVSAPAFVPVPQTPACTVDPGKSCILDWVSSTDDLPYGGVVSVRALAKAKRRRDKG